MKREFNIDDIAHMAKGKRVRGILNYDTEDESYKDFTLRYEDEVKVIKYQKADEKVCGGWIYDCKVEYKDVNYRVECISQFELCGKKLWEKNQELIKKIKELEAKANK